MIAAEGQGELAVERAARVGADPAGGITRLAWTAELAQVTGWVASELADLGLEPETDPAGNLIARWPAPGGPAVMAASHLDTVPSGGAYDGALGVLCAVEAVRRLREEGFEPARPVWIGAFMDEEGARFGTALFGSRCFAGEDMADSLNATDRDGTTLREAITAYGLDPQRIGAAARVHDLGAYLELHIEQGPVLWAAGERLAVVDAIAGVLGFRVQLTGQANHAGTTPMDMRRDALVAGARIAWTVRDEARRTTGLRATVGAISVEGGTRNVVPGRCTLTVDLRVADRAALAGAEPWLRECVAHIAAQEGVKGEVLRDLALDPIALDPGVAAVLEAAASDEGIQPRHMVSGAGHDAMVLARHVPAGMIFLPSRDGVSHSPREWTPSEDCDLGARVLAGTIRRMAG